MRVIAGLCRGKRLKSVKGFSTRPTADRVKEAVFNVLGTRLSGAKVLDLFGGTGSMGIEALSRGATLAVFVEKNQKAVQVIRENLLGCKMEDKSKLYPIDCFKALKILSETNIKFNLIYLDPPYKSLIIDDILQGIVNLNLLEERATVIAETARDADLIVEYNNLKKAREDRYGDTKITYYQVEGSFNDGSL
ncbi:MAG: hypothetical protein VR72_20975 [Clostridiaceae bacterium BRH_c20a]|nr:MAG: hypothetical protein VR72_20975 [Clostridiaceae bacterium BRH_c20a]